MPRPAKGPRLYLRSGRADGRSGRALPDIYFIRDAEVSVSTGCGPDRLPEAERALAAYIAAKWRPQALTPAGRSDPAQIFVAEALALYAAERAPHCAAPAKEAGFIAALIPWWADKRLADVRKSTCQAYVAWRTAQPRKSAKSEAAKARLISDQTARRELEVLSAAIGFWDEEDKLVPRPSVWLPDKPESPRDALTRSEAAALLLGCLGWRKGADGRFARLATDIRGNRRHLRRFVLIALYTGSRPDVIRRLSWVESALDPWVDLDAGVIYRRGRDEREHKTKRRPLVKLPPRLIAHMRRWKALDEKRGAALKANTVVHHGGEALAGKIRTGFAGAVRDGGLNPDITPHWLRHTAATWLMENDVDVWEAAGFLGMTIATLEKCYGHRRPTHQSAARRAFTRRSS